MKRTKKQKAKEKKRKKREALQKLSKYESTQGWLKSLKTASQSQNKVFTRKNLGGRLRILLDCVDFSHLTPDQLLDEGKEDIKAAHARLMNFYNWLQGKNPEGEELPEGVGKRITPNSASTAVRLMRGFYTHNGLTFPKGCKAPKREVSKVRQRDDKMEIYGFDEETGEMTYKNGLIQHFLTNLNFRDQTIALCLMSTGADAADLLNLNMKFVKDAKGNLSKTKRFLWHANRLKDGEEFKVYFSEEATKFLKRYVEQERAEAEGSEPLFVTEDGDRLKPHVLGINFRTASRKMGYTQKGLSHPFRPKRFRRLFRTACGSAGIDPGFTKAFMGHVSDTSGYYLEKNNGLFLKEYVGVEPYVTVFAAEKTELAKELGEVKDKTFELYEGRDELRKQIAELLAWKRSVEQDREFIRYMREEVKHFREGGIVVYYTDDIAKDEMRELIEELKKRRRKQ